jgi:hypothetical protein
MKAKKKTFLNFYDALSRSLYRLEERALIKFLDEYKATIDNTEDWANRWEARSCGTILAFECGRIDYLMVDLIWMLANWEINPTHGNSLEHLTQCERFIDELANCEEVSIAQAKMVLDSLERWAREVNYPANNILYAKMRMYQRMGMTEIALQCKASLLALEATLPVVFKFNSTDCNGCHYTRKMRYYTDLGMLEAALRLGEELFDGEASISCYTAPRGGAAYLLDALLEAGLGDHPMAVRAQDALLKKIDYPFPAPLRVMVPLLRYALWKEDYKEAAAMINNNMYRAESASDTWHAWRFFDVASQHPGFDGAALKTQAERLRQRLQR